jgi:hypothetical protein
MPGGGKIESIYEDLSDQTKKVVDSNPELKKIFKKAKNAPVVEKEVPEEKEAFLETPGRSQSQRGQHSPSIMPGGGKIESIYEDLSDQTKKVVDSNPELKKLFKKADDAPAPAPLPEEAPVVEKEEAPEAPVPEPAPVEKKKATDPKKVVNTNILAYDGIELEAGMQEAEEMSAEEQTRLNQLFA